MKPLFLIVGLSTLLAACGAQPVASPLGGGPSLQAQGVSPHKTYEVTLTSTAGRVVTGTWDVSSGSQGNVHSVSSGIEQFAGSLNLQDGRRFDAGINLVYGHSAIWQLRLGSEYSQITFDDVTGDGSATLADGSVLKVHPVACPSTVRFVVTDTKSGTYSGTVTVTRSQSFSALTGNVVQEYWGRVRLQDGRTDTAKVYRLREQGQSAEKLTVYFGGLGQKLNVVVSLNFASGSGSGTGWTAEDGFGGRAFSVVQQ